MRRGLLFFCSLIFVIFIISSCEQKAQKVKIRYPFEGSVFPAEFPAPGIRWESDSITQEWQIDISINAKIISSNKSNKNIWTPEASIWENVKTKADGNKITISVFALDGNTKTKADSVNIVISKDSVGTPIFFRSVILPFSHANKYKDSLNWYLGEVASNDVPKLMMSKIPACANCHSFSSNGTKFALDVDYANNKGSYAIANIEKTSAIKPENIISWDDYKKDEKESTLGLLSQISPNGEWVVSTVKDRSIFVPIDTNFAYSQLFFPIKGILASYNTKTKTFLSLTGADNPDYVQSSPGWSPDGKEIIFARAKIDNDTAYSSQKGLFVNTSLANDYISGNKGFKYDLWRVPFNNGKGGKAEPIEGASNNGKSNYFPKYSPDGKWLVFCQADNYMLLRKDSRMFIMAAKGGKPRKMQCNTNDMNSWHSWSPNGRWIVYATKHFGPYTQLFLTHIDENGNDSPPIWLEYFDLPKRAINIPEFVNTNTNNWNHIVDAFSTSGNYFQRSIDESINHRDYKSAIHYVNLLLEKEPENTNGYMQKARVNILSQNQNQAIADYKMAMSLIDKQLVKEPKSVVLLKQKTEIFSRIGDFNNAIATYNQIAKCNANEEDNISFKTNILIDANRNQEAIEECNRILKNKPQNTRFLSIRASLYMSINEFPKALQDLNVLLKAQPNNKDFLMKRLNINYMLVRADDCMKDINQILKNGTNEYMVYFIAAQIYDARNEKAEAIKCAKSAINIINTTSLSNPTPEAEKKKVIDFYNVISKR